MPAAGGRKAGYMDGSTVRKTRLLRKAELYPDGANSPTMHYEYRCFCKKGLIIEEDVIGFDDHFITIECDECLEKYHPFIDVSFKKRKWVVYEK